MPGRYYTNNSVILNIFNNHICIQSGVRHFEGRQWDNGGFGGKTERPLLKQEASPSTKVSAYWGGRGPNVKYSTQYTQSFPTGEMNTSMSLLKMAVSFLSIVRSYCWRIIWPNATLIGTQAKANMLCRCGALEQWRNESTCGKGYPGSNPAWV
jgi:hypothetical protein